MAPPTRQSEIARDLPACLHLRRRPARQSSRPAAPGHQQPPGRRRLSGTGQERLAAGPSLHRSQLRLHHPGAGSPGRPRLAPWSHPVVEPLRRHRVAAGRRDAERGVLPPHLPAAVPPGDALPPDPPRNGHRVGDLLADSKVGGGADVLDRRGCRLRIVWIVRLADPRTRPTHSPASVVVVRGRTGVDRRPGRTAGRLAGARRRPRLVDSGRLPRDHLHRRDLRGVVGGDPDVRTRAGLLAAHAGQARHRPAGRDRLGRPVAGGIHHLLAPRQPRRPRPRRSPRLASPGRAFPTRPSLFIRTDLRLSGRRDHRGKCRRHHRFVGQRRRLPHGDIDRRRTRRPGRPAKPETEDRAWPVGAALPSPDLWLRTGGVPDGGGARHQLHRLLSLCGRILGAGHRHPGRPGDGRHRPTRHPAPGVGEERAAHHRVGGLGRTRGVDGDGPGQDDHHRPPRERRSVHHRQLGPRRGRPRRPDDRRLEIGPQLRLRPQSAHPADQAAGPHPRGRGNLRGVRPVARLHLRVGAAAGADAAGFGGLAAEPPGHLPVRDPGPDSAQLRLLLRYHPSQHHRLADFERLGHLRQLHAGHQLPDPHLHRRRHHRPPGGIAGG